jgi:hypothetical protein
MGDKLAGLSRRGYARKSDGEVSTRKKDVGVLKMRDFTSQ